MPWVDNAYYPDRAVKRGLQLLPRIVMTMLQYPSEVEKISDIMERIMERIEYLFFVTHGQKI